MAGTKNEFSLQFNESCAVIVDSLCEPLFNNFGITHFGYLRILENGQILRIANNTEWTRTYFQHEFYNDFDIYSMKHVPLNEQRFAFLIGEPRNEHCKMICSKFKIWNFFLIYEKFPTHGDFWFFGTHPDNLQIINFYINNINLLQHFILYFKSKAFHLFDISNPTKLISSQIRPLIGEDKEKNQVEEFIKEISYNRYFLNGQYEGKSLSIREAECLLFASQGRTMKEIAESIHLSPRTVETYLNNIKNKMGCRTKGEIISIFSKISSPFN